MNDQSSDITTRPRHRPVLICWTLIFVAVSIVAAIASQQPPAERPADAPASEFSSRRAFQHIQAIAAKPRPAGSPEIALVRAYLERTIDSLGLAHTTQTVRYQQANGRAVEISNIVARIKGHPWMPDVGLVLNFDAAGNRGPCTLFETSDQNGWLIREFARPIPSRSVTRLRRSSTR
jgi:hypothetical protein